jgi:hypothetical protein
MCRAISFECQYGIGLSGTPFGKEVEDIWSQFYLIDFGETLGTTKGLFLEAFFNSQKNFHSTNRFARMHLLTNAKCRYCEWSNTASIMTLPVMIYQSSATSKNI